MSFFKPLLTDDLFSVNDLAHESSRIETIDLAGSAALFSTLATVAPAATTVALTAFDANAFNVGEPVHAVAPALSATPAFNHFVSSLPVAVSPVTAVEAAPALDASTTPAIEAVVIASADIVQPSSVGVSAELPAVHAVDSTTVPAIVAQAVEHSTASVEATESATHAVTSTVSTDAVAPDASSSAVTAEVVSSNPWPAVGAFVVLDGDHPASHTATPHAVLVPWWISSQGATGSDDVHAVISVNPSGSASSSVSDPVDTVGHAMSTGTATATDASPVVEAVPHAIVGTVIIDALGNATLEATTGVAVTDTVTTVASEPAQAPEAIDDAAILKNFQETWLCNQPVEPEYLRIAPRPDVTLPSRSNESTGTTDAPSFTAEVFHSTAYHAIDAASTPFVSAEQHAVL